MVIPSEEVTLVDEEHDILSRISPYFQISETKYGGKGCFSYDRIPQGTELVVSNPLGFTISKDFRKEVCNHCFRYDNGESMKTRYTLSGFKNQSLYFCSEQCLEDFTSPDHSGVLCNALLTLDKLYARLRTEDEHEMTTDVDDKDFIHIIKQKWQEVDSWDERVSKMKRTKWDTLVPKINDSEYLEIKYVITVLHRLYVKQQTGSDGDQIQSNFLNQLNLHEQLNTETELFEFLQSNEISKVLKFKNLLASYINIYKFLKLTCPSQYQKFINPLNIRIIIGINLTNAFGIWSLDKGDREFLGFGVYPSGSFFNHSCSPNIVKKRVGNQLRFTTIKEIEKNEELCIDYGNYLSESVEVRRKQLSEWFFICGCVRCETEAAIPSDSRSS